MKKKLHLTLCLILAIFSWNKVVAFDYDFTVTPADIHGKISITNNSIGFGSSWDLQIGPAGFIEDNMPAIQNFNGITTTIKLTTLPYFQAYDIRIRNYDQYGIPLEWSDITTYDNCANTFFTVGYTEDFNQPNGYCWRAYTWPLDSYWADVIIDSYNYEGSEGNAISMVSEYANNLAVMVLPRFSDLSTDKKVVFSVKGYTSSALKLVSLSDPNNAGNYSLIEVIPGFPAPTQWEQVTVHLNNYNGVDPYLALIYEKKPFGSTDVQIDNFSYEQSINCFKPQDLELNDISQTSATLNFDGMGESNWEISIVYDIYEPQIFTTDTESFVIEDLNANMEYEIKVRAHCGPGHYSGWSDPITLQTSCDDMVSGYSTSFGVNDADNCWKKLAEESSYEIGVTSGYFTNLLPRTGDYLAGIGSYSAEGYGYLVSPYVENIDNNKRIEFYLIALNNNALTPLSSLTVGTMTDPTDETTFTPVYTIEKEDINMTSDPYEPRNWKKHIVYFNNYTGSDHYIAFRHDNDPNDDSFDGTSFYIDDFSYTDIPACSEPTNPKVIDFDYDFVTIGWDVFSTSTSTQWQIEYGPKGFVQGSGTFVTATSNPFTINDVDSNTEYDYYIRSICGSEVSLSTSVQSFRTRCSGFSVGYSEDFEDAIAGEMDNCWRRLTPYFNDTYWSPNSFISISSSENQGYAHSGTKSIRFVNQLAAPATNISEKSVLVTPRLLDLDSDKNISFWMYSRSTIYADPDEIIIGTLSDPDDYTTFTPFYTITNAGDIEDEWVFYEVDFSGYNGTDEYIGIRQAEENGDQIVFIDDFSYYQITCPTPTELTVQQSGSTQVDVIWDSNNANVSSYEIEYGPIGFEPGTGTVIATDENPYTLDNLAEGSSYSVRVRTYCTDETYSQWSLIYDFRLGCSETAPFYEDFDEYDINTIIINPDLFCWTTNNYAAHLQDQCIDGYYSCPNSISLAQNLEGIGVLISPYLSDFDNTKRIRFHAHDPVITEEDPAIIIVGTIVNPLDLSTFEPYTTITLDSNAPYGKQYEVDFSDYNGIAKYVAFKHGNEISYTYVFLDDIHYLPASTCPEPLNVTAQNINSSSALATWEVPAGINNFEIEYGESGFTQGEGTTIVATGSQQLIEELDAQTEYEFYIRSVCNDLPSEVFVGPITFTTTCAEQPLPWLETFQGMASYGDNLVPDCFRLTEGEVISCNTLLTLTGSFDNDHTLTGINDTHYLRIYDEYYTNLITPSFSLTAGTTYTFSFMARKSYEFEFLRIKIFTGRGNTEAALTTQLSQIGTISEFQYNNLIFYFTPVESGDYSFLFEIDDPGGINAVIDNIGLEETDITAIDDIDISAGFEDGIEDFIIPEATDLTSITTIDEGGNNVAFMDGAWLDEDWIETAGRFVIKTTQDNENGNDNLWLLNENFITKLNMKVDASQMENLTLHFDLKQTYNNSPNESQFRVVINGNVVNTFFPVTNYDDEYETYNIDLSAYVGGEIKISLQHLGRFFTDSAYVDNIAFTQEEETLPCAEPTNITVTDITQNSVLVNWEAPEGVDNFEIEYEVSGFTLGEGTIIEVAGVQQLIEELDSQTDYDFYIRSVCEDNNSVDVGPGTFTTADPEVPCTVFTIPWTQNFNALTNYGNNILPHCFTLQSGEVESYQGAVTITNGSYASNTLITGVNDTHFIRVYNSFETNFTTPLISLTAGTTYKFSYMARKGNAGSPLNIDINVGMENSEEPATLLSQDGVIEESDYNVISYNYTPIESGNYNLLFNLQDTQGIDVLLDNISINEGYAETVNNIETIAGFENGFEDFIIAEEADNTIISVIEEEDNNVVKMQGGISNTNWNNANGDMWAQNENFITKVNMKIDASQMEELTLYFNLRQTFVNSQNESLFRVVVNGITLNNIIIPESASNDEYTAHSVDLSAFAGTDIRLSLQHLGKHDGDNAYIDNIAFQQEDLSVENTIFTHLMVYPNPTKSKLKLVNNFALINNVEVYNIHGQKLYENNITSNNAEIDLTNYSTGIYFVKISIGQNEKVYKIIKE